MPAPSDVVLLPDAGPLITLAYADALGTLFKPGWRVAVLDMVLLELMPNHTPTGQKLAHWVESHAITVLNTQTGAHYPQEAAKAAMSPVRKANLGELAVQEPINQFALQRPPQTAVFLFEDHRIARTSFLLPEHCQKISTRAFLIFLKQKGWIESAGAKERQAAQAGRNFSQLRFPPG